MGKDPSAVVLATALAFCAFCPFFARCNDSELNHLENGIDSLTKILVKYLAEFDNKVKFAQLQKAIDEIDDAMRGYAECRTKEKLPLIRSLNSDARQTYKNLVGPVFEWCRSINSSFDKFIGFIGARNQSETNMNFILNLTGSALEFGLKETEKSLELLTHYENKVKELDIAFRDILFDVQYDFSPRGFYGEERVKLQERINDNLLRFSSAFIGVSGLVYSQQKERIENIELFFTVLTKKIENATEIVKDIERALDEDKTNLYTLRGHIERGNIAKLLLLSDMALVRVHSISDIKNLMDSCAKYVNRHKYEALL